ncbi:hypothetical protein HAX54_035312 [Datura stramonium]|uniref:Uncharacterized protein n=1 Tax=Datura stramonium TaxID=4076 RepID=A0ABS8SF69_DATST|nr:hypothetical protein [Datura stramonium]
MAETTNFNDLQVMFLANTQEEPQVEGRIDPRQEIDQFGSSIHDLQGLLNEKVEASESQLQRVVDSSQYIEQEKESEPLDDTLLVDDDVEEVDKSEDDDVEEVDKSEDDDVEEVDNSEDDDLEEVDKSEEAKHNSTRVRAYWSSF